MLERLDWLEGHPFLYVRVPWPCVTASGTVVCWLYLDATLEEFGRPVPGGLRQRPQDPDRRRRSTTEREGGPMPTTISDAALGGARCPHGHRVGVRHLRREDVGPGVRLRGVRHRGGQ